VDDKGFSPLHKAIYANNYDLAKFFIESLLPNQVISRPSRDELAYARNKVREFVNAATDDEYEFTSLHFASFQGNPGIIHLLMQHGADPKAKSAGGLTMLHMAA